MSLWSMVTKETTDFNLKTLIIQLTTKYPLTVILLPLRFFSGTESTSRMAITRSPR